MWGLLLASSPAAPAGNPSCALFIETARAAQTPPGSIAREADAVPHQVGVHRDRKASGSTANMDRQGTLICRGVHLNTHTVR